MRRVIIIAALSLAFAAQAQDAANWWNALAVDGGAAALPDVTDGLIAWWKMDELAWDGTAGEVIDSIGSNNGVAVNGCSVTSGKTGNAAYFSGATPWPFVDVGTEAFATLSSNSVSLWFKPLANGATGANAWHCPTIFCNDNIYFGILFAAGNKIRVYHWIGSPESYDSSAALTTNTWNHIVLSYDAGGSKLYINGLLDTISAVTWVNTDSGWIGKNITMGAQSLESYLSFSALTGLLDDVRVYGRELSSNEVSTICNRYK